MKFRVLSSTLPLPHPEDLVAVLSRSTWNDWYKFETTFELLVLDSDGFKLVGAVKIGMTGMGVGRASVAPDTDTDKRSPQVPEEFDELSPDFFSVGQDDSYYERLGQLGDAVRVSVLTALRDVAFSPDAYAVAEREYVFQESLVRSVSEAAILGQYRRIAHGQARLSHYSFAYSYSPFGQRRELGFEVVPESSPPTNIHVIVGRNGVGKTILLQSMVHAFLKVEHRSPGDFSHQGAGDFGNLVYVSFSAFDEFEPPRIADHGKRYQYVGLRRSDRDAGTDVTKSPSELTREFLESLRVCLRARREDRWTSAVASLESDPIFAAANVSALANLVLHEKAALQVAKTFDNLSSGHKIVLLTISRLVECAEESSLILFDEPEAHLHPPLLSALVRAVSQLLILRNGVAIVVTHSPVVLQEVPRKCVWLMGRSGAITRFDRPERETFAENVGTLTREVFGLEVVKSGFHALLESAYNASLTYEDACNTFGGQLGLEGQAILRSLFLQRVGAEG